MDDHTRRAVAYIAGRAVSGRNSGAVYDYGASAHFHFSGNVPPQTVSVYDYDQSCHVGGSLPSLYHYGNSQHVTLQINRSNFTGYDYAASSHFSGSVSASSVSIYDYGQGRHDQYSL